MAGLGYWRPRAVLSRIGNHVNKNNRTNRGIVGLANRRNNGNASNNRGKKFVNIKEQNLKQIDFLLLLFLARPPRASFHSLYSALRDVCSEVASPERGRALKAYNEA